MGDLTLAREIVFVLGMALVGGYLAVLFKIPTIVGYLLSGIISSVIFPQITNSANIATLSEVGVALLMFSLGIEFSFRRLLRVREIVVTGAVLQILIFTILELTAFLFLGFDFYSSLFMASVFSLSSTAVVVKLLNERGEIATHPGEIMVGWLLIQDLAVLPLTIFLPAIGEVFLGSTAGSSIIIIGGALFKILFLTYILLILGKRLVPAFLDRVAKTKSRELLLLSVFSMCLVFAFGSRAVGFSFALGAFLAGILVSESTSNHAIFAEIRPLRDVFSIIFFVSLGLLFSPVFFFSNLWKILGITLLVIVFKFLVVFLLNNSLKQHIKVSFMVGLGLVQVGEFAFVLSRDAALKSFISSEIYNYILSVAFISILLTPIFFKYGEKVFFKFKAIMRNRLPKLYDRIFGAYKIEKESSAGLLYSNHVVLCGHGRVGHQISRILDLARIPYVVVDYNLGVVNKLKENGVDVVYGDPSDIDVLDYAEVDKAQSVVIAVPDRHSQEMIIENSLKLNPRVNIICRSHFEEDRERLLTIGAKSVVQPEFEAGLSIAYKLLEYFGYSHEESLSFLKLLRTETGMR